jgi:hypothetical protein
MVLACLLHDLNWCVTQCVVPILLLTNMLLPAHAFLVAAKTQVAC